jgi:hypothetical protein
MPETAGQAGWKRNAAGGTEPAGSSTVPLSISATCVDASKLGVQRPKCRPYGKKRSTRRPVKMALQKSGPLGKISIAAQWLTCRLLLNAMLIVMLACASNQSRGGCSGCGLVLGVDQPWGGASDHRGGPDQIGQRLCAVCRPADVGHLEMLGVTGTRDFRCCWL